jgi:hypothetical protein
MKAILSHINEILIALGTLGTLGGSWFAWKKKTKKDKVQLKIEVDKLYEQRIIELAAVNDELQDRYFEKSNEAAKYKLILIQMPVDCPECAACIKKITDKL